MAWLLIRFFSNLSYVFNTLAIMFKRVLAYGVVTLFIAGILVQLNSYLALVNIHHTPSLDEQDTVITQPQHYHRDNTALLSYISILLVGGLLLLARSWIQKARYRKAKLLGLLGFTTISPWQRWLRYERQLFSCVTVSLIDLIKVGSVISVNAWLLFSTATSTIPENDPQHAGFQEPNLYRQSLSHRAAQLAVANIAFSVLLSAKLSIIQRYFYQVNETIRWHAWFGRIGFFQVLYHASYQIQTNYTNQDRSIVAALSSNVRHTTGAFMLSAMFLLLFGSHSLVRFVSYRLFRITHLAALAVLICSGCFHHWSFYVFYVTVLLFWVMDQIDRSYRTDLLMAEALPGDVVKIKCSIPYSMNAGLIPGQFVFISLTPSTLAATVYAHPFSVCRIDSNDTPKEEGEEEEEEAANEEGGALNEGGSLARSSDGHSFTFYIKATGNRTKPLYDIAQSGSKMIKGRISRPMGRPYVTSAGAEFGDFDQVILVAEGMGITPWTSVLQYIEQKQHAIKTKLVNLIWSIHSIGE